MTLPRVRLRSVLIGLVAVVVVASYLFSALSGFRHSVERQAEVTGHPFVISDLFGPWYGARALIAGRDVYGEALNEQIHTVYYGRPQVPTEDLPNVTGFFYPPFIVLTLAPFVWLPFEIARWLATLALGAAVVGGALIWARLTGAQLESFRAKAAIAVCALLFYPTIELLCLQQITGFVLFYLVAAHALAARRHYAPAGMALALAMVKPQVAAIPVAGLLVWSLWRRERRRMAVGFGVVMAAQLSLSFVLLPTWIGGFVESLGRYRRSNGGTYWIPAVVTGSLTPIAAALVCLLLLVLACVWWRCRDAEAASPAVVRAAALTLVISATVVPDVSIYNRTLLLLPLLTLFTNRQPEGLLARFVTRLAALAVTEPIVVVVLVTWVHLISPSALIPSLAARSPTIMIAILPLFILPAMLRLSLSAGTRRRPAAFSWVRSPAQIVSPTN